MQFFIFKTVGCIWVKRFYTNTLLFFALLGTASHLETFYMSLHNTKYKPPWLFKLGKSNNRHPVSQFLNFLLGSRFSFEAYAKKVREKTINRSLRFYWKLMLMCLPKFDIYQGNVATNCLKSHTNSWCSDFDILSVAETKLDNSLPNTQFLILNFHQPFHLHIGRNTGGTLLFVGSSIPVKILFNYRLPPEIEAIPLM